MDENHRPILPYTAVQRPDSAPERLISAAARLQVAGVLAVLIGLPYISNLMHVEGEVAAWGLLSVAMGVVLVVVARFAGSLAVARRRRDAG